MRRIITFIVTAALLCTGVLVSCSIDGKALKGKTVTCKGEVVTRTLDSLEGYEAVLVSSAAEIRFVQSPDYRVTVEANSEVFDHLDYSVSKDGVLVLDTKGHVNVKARKYEITVEGPVLKAINVKGACEWEMKDYSSGTEMEILVNGASEMDLKNIAVPTLTVGVNGASELTIDRLAASTLTFEVNGAAELDVKGLDADTLSLTLNGAGEADLSGRADDVRFEVNGAGSIDARELKTVSVSKSKHGAASIKL